jgi:predicted CoA-substrate-specific enzyme activase
MIYAGVDVGSLSTDAVLIDDEKIILAYSIVPTGVNTKKASEECLKQTLAQINKSQDEITYTVSTGYSRVRVPFADEQVTEITCHAKGANYFFPEARTVLDIGGQDSKAMKITKDGKVLEFAMNDKCAAGTGRFLEVMARALEIELDEMGELSLQSTKKLKISSVCTVFAESEVVSLLARGESAADIALALHEAISQRTKGLMAKVGIEQPVVITGGVAKNIGIIKSLEEILKIKLLIPSEPQIIGALGAALLARTKYMGGAGKVIPF